MPKRKLRFRLLAALLAPAMFLVLVEGGLRVAGWSYDPAARLAGQELRPELERTEIYRPHPRYLWTLRPNAVIDVPPAGMNAVRTNSKGLRSPELPESKAPGEFRVLCLGDSVTFGLGLTEVQAYPSQLEIALRERIEGARVINLGVPGWSSVQGRRLLEDLSDLDPDVVVFWFGLNDAKENMGMPDGRLKPGKSSSAEMSRPSAIRVVQLFRWFTVRYRRWSLGETRVGPEEFSESIEMFRAAGATAVYVRYPEQSRTTIGEFESILAQAREAGVDRVAGPVPVLTPLAPAPSNMKLTGVRIPSDDGPMLRFSGPGRVIRKSVEVLAAERERLARRQEHFEALMARLPGDSPGYEDLFGDLPPDEVFTDNCHLTPAGARRAGRALAGWIADRATAGRR